MVSTGTNAREYANARELTNNAKEYTTHAVRGYSPACEQFLDPS